jgi:hypothetical protein
MTGLTVEVPNPLQQQPTDDASELQRKKAILDQVPPNLHPSNRRMGGLRSENRIVKYNPADLRVFRALWGMTSRTILVNE